MKNVRKNLLNFDTRIVSTIRASPASFAKVLTNEILYEDFRFDSNSKHTDDSPEGKKRIEHSRMHLESVYN